MIDPESDEMRLAVFGRQVEMFLESDVGTYIVQCADTEIDAATEKLKDVNPEDPKAIRDLQFKIRVAQSVVGWLGDAIRSGAQAKEVIQEGQ